MVRDFAAPQTRMQTFTLHTNNMLRRTKDARMQTRRRVAACVGA
jgi:hypothetical protein